MLIHRMMRAAGLDANLYDEVEKNKHLTFQALVVVIVVSLASGLGSMLSEATAGRGAGGMLNALVFGAGGAVVFWVIWSFLVYWIAVRYFRGKTTYGTVVRCLGFAYSPGALNLFRFVRVLGGLVSFIVFIWVLCAGIIAVRQSLGITDGKAMATVVIGWVIAEIARGIVMWYFGVAVF